ncbi:hypothetical protein [Dysosmobacter sp. Sow4_B12]|uniref:hypothetical protein n=1 Tax=Dysosmobacter sp. Sow4_B12 TaxID=3438777 RepID=UPI003F936EFE
MKNADTFPGAAAFAAAPFFLSQAGFPARGFAASNALPCKALKSPGFARRFEFHAGFPYGHAVWDANQPPASLGLPYFREER